MLQWRRVAALLVVAVLAFPFVSVNLFGQDKSGKDTKKEDTKKEDTKKEDTKKEDAKDKVTLKWKFEKGKSFYQKMDTDTKQTMKVMNNEVKQNQMQTFYFQWTPQKQDGDNWVIEQKIIGVKMEIDIGGQKINYDSTSTNAANNASNPLSDFFKALVGSTFSLTLDTKTLKVTKVEGREEFLKKLTTANPQMKPLLDQILSENALKEMAEPTFAIVPTEPVAKGQKWTRKTTLSMGPIGTYENDYTYTFEGKDDKDKKLNKIKVETVLKYKEPGEVAGVGGLPFKIKSADLKSTNANGTILWNEDKGRVDRSDMTLNLKGELSIEIGGQTTKVELEQTQTTNVLTSDEDPLAAKKK
jgi:hypothetical protein